MTEGVARSEEQVVYLGEAGTPLKELWSVEYPCSDRYTP